MFNIQEMFGNLSDLKIVLAISVQIIFSLLSIYVTIKEISNHQEKSVLADTFGDYPASFEELNEEEKENFDILYRIINMPTSEEVCEPEAYKKLAEYLASKGISRRKIPDFIADILYNEDFQFVDKNGKIIEFDDEVVDRVFGEDESCRWFGDFMERRFEAWKQVPQERVIKRLVIISAVMKADMKED